MDISVVISVGRKDIRETIESLRSQRFSGQWEIVLVTHLNKELFESYKIEKIYFVEKNNAALKRNIGVRCADGKIIAFIDDDAYAPPDWLQKGYNFMSMGNNSIVGVGGPNLLLNGVSDKERLTDAILNFPVFGSGNVSYKKNELINRRARCGEIHFVNFFVLKEVFLAIGGINEMVAYGGEDTEFVYLIDKKLNKEIRFFSDLFVYHHRRPFGLSYLKQRFLFRFNNGVISIAYPAMYIKEPAFLILLFFSLSLPFLLILKPALFLVLYCCFFIWVLLYGFIKEKSFFYKLPFAMSLHLSSYLLGFLLGFIWGLINLKKTLHLRRI